jgi:hypothetical protein
MIQGRQREQQEVCPGGKGLREGKTAQEIKTEGKTAQEIKTEGKTTQEIKIRGKTTQPALLICQMKPYYYVK